MSFLPGCFPGAVMETEAFPVVMGRDTTEDDSIGGSMSVGLPSGIVAGELLLICANFPNASASGWTDEASTTRSCVLWRIATGSEGSSVTISAGGGFTSHGASVAYRIKGGKSVELSSEATGTSDNPNPASLSPSWGNKKTLWFAMMTASGTSSGISVSDYPTGFTNQQSAQGLTTFPSAARIAVAERQEQVASLNPSTFTIGTTTIPWSAYTIAVKP